MTEPSVYQLIDVPTSPLGPAVPGEGVWPEKVAPEGCTVTLSKPASVSNEPVYSVALRENVIVQASPFP
jgi:hypothetical protein